MNKQAKHLTTAALLVAVTSPLLLYLTSTDILPSQSAYAGKENAIWYTFIHMGMTMAFFTLGASSKKNTFYVLTAFSSIATVVFDLYDYHWNHNISTFFIFVFASLSLVFYLNKRYQGITIPLTIIAGLVFGAEFLNESYTPFSIFGIEYLIESSYAGMIVVDMYQRGGKSPKSNNSNVKTLEPSL
jgi:hypothetical protein